MKKLINHAKIIVWKVVFAFCTGIVDGGLSCAHSKCSHALHNDHPWLARGRCSHSDDPNTLSTPRMALEREMERWFVHQSEELHHTRDIIDPLENVYWEGSTIGIGWLLLRCAQRTETRTKTPGTRLLRMLRCSVPMMTNKHLGKGHDTQKQWMADLIFPAWNISLRGTVRAPSRVIGWVTEDIAVPDFGLHTENIRMTNRTGVLLEGK